MTILLDHLTADASRSIPRAEGATARQLWANPARIVENGLQWYCGCFVCNRYKGPNIAGVDPLTARIVTLFHPRRDFWDDHFVWHGPELHGRTAQGRATIDVLKINHPDYVVLRRGLIAEGVFPSAER